MNQRLGRSLPGLGPASGVLNAPLRGGDFSLLAAVAEVERFADWFDAAIEAVVYAR